MAGFISTHDRAKAQQEFVGVTRIDPRYAPAWFNLGVLAELDQNWGEAKRDFEAYLQLVASGSDANRAREQLKLVDDYANNTVNPAQIRQQEYDAAIQRSRSFLAVGLFREAIAEAGRAQALDQSRWEAYAVVSIAMRRQHRIHEAIHFQNLAADHAPAEKREQVFDALLQTDAVGSH
jgi:tetratricopeptide (TPR) repeat protein